jgi:hypothetical protein
MNLAGLGVGTTGLDNPKMFRNQFMLSLFYRVAFACQLLSVVARPISLPPVVLL